MAHIDLRGAMLPLRNNDEKKPTALLIGAVGRLGEALLNQLVEKYSTCYVACREPLLSTTRQCVGLHWQQDSLAPLSDFALANYAFPAVDDVYIYTGERGLSNQRDIGMHTISDAQLLQAATQAAAKASSHDQRLCIIRATAAQHQASHFVPLGVDDLAVSLAELNFAAISLIYPRVIEFKPPRALHWWQRLGQFYLAQFRYMLPSSVAPLTSQRIAQACVIALQTQSAGIARLSTRELRQLLGLDQSKREALITNDAQ